MNFYRWALSILCTLSILNASAFAGNPCGFERHTETDTAAGALGGAVIGGELNRNGSWGWTALAGGVIGGLIGNSIGKQDDAEACDRYQERLRESLGERSLGRHDMDGGYIEIQRYGYSHIYGPSTQCYQYYSYVTYPSGYSFIGTNYACYYEQDWVYVDEDDFYDN